MTGAAGFIGGHLIAALQRCGHRVVAVDRRRVPAAAGVAVKADLALPYDEELRAVLCGADVVFHLAGSTGVRGGAGVEAQRRRDNVDATRRLLEAVPLATPLIVASSSSVYGGTSGRPCHEADRPRPRGGYAQSKLDVERLCAHRVSLGGHVAVARPFTVAGERQRSDMAISRWLEAARTGAVVDVYGGLDRTRDITDVRAVVEGLVRMASRGVRATVNLGTGQAVRLRDILDAVGEATGTRPRIRVRPVGADEPPHTLADTSRCQQLLGFTPTTDLNAVVRRQAAAAGLPVAFLELA